MKNTSLFFALSIGCTFLASGQLANKSYNQMNHNQNNTQREVRVNGKQTDILVKVIYNVIPDGYLLTYTDTYTGKTITELEAKMNFRMDRLIDSVKHIGIDPKDVAVDLLAIDPVFDFTKNDSIPPSKYRVTQNITFQLNKLNDAGKLTKICLDFGIYDLINIQAYTLRTDEIQDSLDQKAVEILNQKKTLCKNVGINMEEGIIGFENFKNVFYPSEKYLRSYITNSTYFNHTSSENSSLYLERKMDIDNYYNYNLKNADFVFNENSTGPLIQFYSQLEYTNVRKDTEEEIREQIRKEEENKPNKEFFILDKEGKLTKISL